MIFALVGNQNCGKTTLFNELTGASRHVGNFPGVTVDAMEGIVRGHAGCRVADLPGVYSLRPYSAEEAVTRDFIVREKPDGIINIVDGTNLERNLYLTLQLLEMRVPMVLALNMMDAVRAAGGSIDVAKLSAMLGIPVVPITAAKGEGIEVLADAAETAVRKNRVPLPAAACGPEKVLQTIRRTGLDRDAAEAATRYDFLESVCAAAVTIPAERRQHARSRRIDDVLTHKVLSIPIFIAVILTVFWLTFDVIGERLSTLLAHGIGSLTQAVDSGLVACGVGPIARSLVIEGVFQGVGNVLAFLPIIVVLFFFLSMLEDTGYLARVAFMADKPLRKIGLSGKSIVPLLIGFGCTVPAVMATRTLTSDRDRRMTVLLTPYMSCSAKIPIYLLFAASFYPGHEIGVMSVLYLGGVLMGTAYALACRASVFRGEPIPFVMELPDYRVPSAKTTLRLMWDKAKDFLHRAFTIVFAASIAIWFLQTFDVNLRVTASGSESLLALIGGRIAPVFAPLGFADWRVSTALLSGLMAKESVVSTLGILLGGRALTCLFTRESAAGFLTFTLLYTPCVAAMAAIRRELNSVWQTTCVVVFQCAVAWICGAMVFQIAQLF